MKILAIETSCDETSVAVVEDGHTLLSLVTNSQIDIQKAFGGVVPEVAARSHLEVMLPVIEQALDQAFPVNYSELVEEPNGHNGQIFRQAQDDKSEWQWDQIDAIAVTQGPGLLGSLLIGVLTARTLAWSRNKPLIAVHHILGHIYANWITQWQLPASSDQENTIKKALPTNQLQMPTSQPEFPILALVVSGGHTQLMYATNHMDWKVIGRTQDDAVGEAFDKVAKILGLPYPGGVSVSKLAEQGDPTKYKLPTPRADVIAPGLTDLRRQGLELEKENSKIQDPSSKLSYNFSFSGLKTAVLRVVQKECGVGHEFPSFELANRLNDAQKADFAASFQRTAIDYLVAKTKSAFDEFQPKTIIIGGGVAASLPLRAALSSALPIKIEYAPQVLCTDNAAMIGARAFYQIQNEEPADPRQLDPKPSWPL